MTPTPIYLSHEENAVFLHNDIVNGHPVDVYFEKRVLPEIVVRYGDGALDRRSIVLFRAHSDDVCIRAYQKIVQENL